jgi:hypothetical protein
VYEALSYSDLHISNSALKILLQLFATLIHIGASHAPPPTSGGLRGEVFCWAEEVIDQRQ